MKKYLYSIENYGYTDQILNHKFDFTIANSNNEVTSRFTSQKDFEEYIRSNPYLLGKKFYCIRKSMCEKHFMRGSSDSFYNNQT